MVKYKQFHVVKRMLGRQERNIIGKNFDGMLEPLPRL